MKLAVKIITEKFEGRQSIASLHESLNSKQEVCLTNDTEDAIKSSAMEWTGH